jgi:hypothetical protein
MILDVLGRRCSDSFKVAGLMVGEECSKALDFSNLNPGVYIARIEAKGIKKTENHFFRFAVR